jgi:hypothetical protein
MQFTDDLMKLVTDGNPVALKDFLVQLKKDTDELEELITLNASSGLDNIKTVTMLQLVELYKSKYGFLPPFIPEA